MDSSLLYMFLYSSDDARRIIGQGVDIKLSGLLEKLIDQYRSIRSEPYSCSDVAFQRVFIVNNRHRSSTQNVTGTNQDWITYASSNFSRLLNRRRHAILRLWNCQFVEKRPKSLTIFCEIDRVGRRSNHSNSGLVKTHRQIQRRLTAKLNYDTFRFFDIDDIHNIFKSERFKIEAVGSVVVS